MKTICIVLGLLAGCCMANATSQVTPDFDKPARLYVESYTYTEHAEIHPSGETYDSSGAATYSFQNDVIDVWGMNWSDGAGGQADWHGRGLINYHLSDGTSYGLSTEDDTYQWPASDWEHVESVGGTCTIDHETTDENGVVTISDDSGTGPCFPLQVARAGNSAGPMDYSGGFLDQYSQQIGYEHCDVSDSQSGSESVPDGSGGHADARDDVVYSRHAETVMKLYTGGKALSKRQNLFMLSATANKLMGMKLKPNLLGVANPQEWELPPVWGPEVGVAPTEIEIDGKEIPANQLMAFGKQVGADGNLWVVQPDNAEPLVGLTAPGKKHYYAGATPTKYKSHLEVFVRQPFPNWPNDGYDNDPNSPTYNPAPPGYPYYNLGDFDAGHAWWRLSSDASADAIRLFTTDQCARWLNEAVGYGPDDTAHMISWVPPIKEGPGHVYGGDGSQTAYRIYATGFQGLGLIDGLNQTESLFENPGTWNSSTHNCVHETIQTGKAAGITLPTGDYYPEFFGLDMPPSDP